MNFRFAAYIFILFCCFGCKINQTKNHLREGRWIEKYELDSLKYVSKGRFRHDEEIRTWKYRANKKLIKKEVYKNGICYVTNYHPNGKIASIGKTTSQRTETERHWFYFGDWNFYNENGKLESIRYYEKGELINETQMN